MKQYSSLPRGQKVVPLRRDGEIQPTVGELVRIKTRALTPSRTPAFWEDRPGVWEVKGFLYEGKTIVLSQDAKVFYREAVDVKCYPSQTDWPADRIPTCRRCERIGIQPRVPCLHDTGQAYEGRQHYGDVGEEL